MKMLSLLLIASIAATEQKKEPVVPEKPDTIADFTVQIQLKPKYLQGISQDQIDQHWKLYEGYIEQANALNKELKQLRNDGLSGNSLYADRRRRFGFEYNGVVLHELYFQNLQNSPKKEPSDSFKDELKKNFSSFEQWQEDFKNAGKTRGIGWAILYMDPLTGHINNIFVADHEIGTIAGFFPILVMDVWEHAYMVDHGALGRANYISSFMNNINWDVVEQRFNDAKKGLMHSRYLK